MTADGPTRDDAPELGADHVDIEQVVLPGIGLRQDFATRAGDRIGVVTLRDGRRELILYDHDDPDASRERLLLADDEADALAELLGAPRITARLADLQQQLEGVVTEQLPVRPGSPYAGRTLGDTHARSRTGASVVAIVRGLHVIASPNPMFRFDGGDVLVVVGTPEGCAAVGEILSSAG